MASVNYTPDSRQGSEAIFVQKKKRRKAKHAPDVRAVGDNSAKTSFDGFNSANPSKNNLQQFSFMESYLNSTIDDSLRSTRLLSKGDKKRPTSESLPYSQISTFKGSHNRKRSTFDRLPPWSNSKLASYSWEKYELEKHVSRLVNVKPKVDCSPPNLKLHCYINYKKLQAMEQRAKELKEKNERMARNLLNVTRQSCHSKPHVDCWNWNTTKGPIRVNPQKKERARESERIAKDNRAMAGRITATNSSYETSRAINMNSYYRARVDGVRMRKLPSLTIVTDPWVPGNKGRASFKHLKTGLPAQ